MRLPNFLRKGCDQQFRRQSIANALVIDSVHKLPNNCGLVAMLHLGVPVNTACWRPSGTLLRTLLMYLMDCGLILEGGFYLGTAKDFALEYSTGTFIIYVHSHVMICRNGCLLNAVGTDSYSVSGTWKVRYNVPERRT